VAAVPITGTCAWWWMLATQAKTSIAKSPCRTPFRKDSRWWMHRNETIALSRLVPQRVSSALCEKAFELYKGGAIGDVELVELSMGRNDPNGAWQYPPPPDLSPQNLDWDTWLNDAPKIPFDPLRFAALALLEGIRHRRGWRLMVHLLSGMQKTLGWNEAPRSATSIGGIFRWKDGRNMPDTLLVLFDYHGIPVYVRLNLGSPARKWRASWAPGASWRRVAKKYDCLRSGALTQARAITLAASGQVAA